MVQIVVPLSGVTAGPTRRTRQITGLVAIVFEDEVDFPIGDPAPHGLRQLGQDIGLAVVMDRMDGIEAEPVKGVFLKPIERVVDHEVAHRPARAARKNRAPRPTGYGAAR